MQSIMNMRRKAKNSDLPALVSPLSQLAGRAFNAPHTRHDTRNPNDSSGSRSSFSQRQVRSTVRIVMALPDISSFSTSTFDGRRAGRPTGGFDV